MIHPGLTDLLATAVSLIVNDVDVLFSGVFFLFFFWSVYSSSISLLFVVVNNHSNLYLVC